MLGNMESDLKPRNWKTKVERVTHSGCENTHSLTFFGAAESISPPNSLVSCLCSPTALKFAFATVSSRTLYNSQAVLTYEGTLWLTLRRRSSSYEKSASGRSR